MARQEDDRQAAISPASKVAEGLPQRLLMFLPYAFVNPGKS
jgi:hypothetical protein